ncbi:MAG: hypothetical protein LJF06_17260 [Gemmatimonadetes bacterium]|nr:hypothetical protein [Gemmatimonadota bacterium]
MSLHPIVRRGAHRLRHHARGVWESRGGGFYGFVAMVTFLCLEGMNLVGDLAALRTLQLSIGGLISWLVQNVVQGLLTALWAAIWPVAWISRVGVGVKLGVLLAASYGIYRLIRPTVTRWLREPGELEGE